ncbi:cytochrome b561 domain-containing protein At2g30890-like [Phalaenopsis equestris]|uniref:cytochrome b561 domain-containing protein At2g30890-like n=1 Tax=Phalaenopsis equestris TaxID=78828 RepID=UPI0009E3951D|nr:cytochrome b561 domain-containing protein At2g30890-like [Phalaenopsis equestris]
MILNHISYYIVLDLFICCKLGLRKGMLKSTPVHHSSLKFSSELNFQVKLHAFLLWASIGFLMPVGILIIRISSRVQCGRRLKIIFLSHVVLQMAAVLLATGAAVLSVRNFDNSFSNMHQRIGLGLYGLILVQPLIGFLRPHRGVKLRSIWYTIHWLFGTVISIIGIINIYFGLNAYEKKSSESLRIWKLLLAFQLVIFSFIYLLQGRWDYIKKQGVILGDEQISPTDVQISRSPQHTNHKDLPSSIML